MNEDASEQYDRQIRLWGVDAQKRMSGSKVLFSGINGVSESRRSNRGKKLQHVFRLLLHACIQAVKGPAMRLREVHT